MRAREAISLGAFESEVALVIKDDAGHVRTELAGIRHISEYDLRPKPRRIIHDTYFDTPENSLRERKITLRTRRQGNTRMISTKSDVRRISGNIIRRRETELPWRYDSLRLLARKLKLKTPTVSISQFEKTSASRTLAALGLEAIQERRTKREPRDVVRGSGPSTSILAELAIDMVTYTFNDIKVEFSMVEVEAKSTGSLASVREIAKALVLRYRPSLQQWFHGKFLTGLAIRKLVETTAFRGYLVNSELGPEAFKLIDRAIRSRRF